MIFQVAISRRIDTTSECRVIYVITKLTEFTKIFEREYPIIDVGEALCREKSPVS